MPEPHADTNTAEALGVPAGSVDAHMHVFLPGMSVLPGRNPPLASIEDYLQLRKELGISRNVVVAPSSYGYDNTSTLLAIETIGESARGVAAVRPDVSDDELRILHDGGVRGIRCNFSRGADVRIEHVEALAPRVARLGWHVQLAVTPELLQTQGERLLGVAGTLVIDHLGKTPQPEGIHHPTFAALVRLVESGRVYVKLSGAYLTSKAGAPDYGDVEEVVAALVRLAPDRLVWGSDWPHATAPGPEAPDTRRLLDLLAKWVPKSEDRGRILVDNPHRLYFES